MVALHIYKNEYKRNTWSFHLNLPLSIDRNRLDYNRPALVDTAITKHYALFRPSLRVSKKWINTDESGRVRFYHELKASYRFAMQPASIDYFVNVRTNDNPLEVYTGNNGLRPSNSHRWEMNYLWNSPETQRMVSANISYLLSHNDVAMGYTYDRLTGVYTYRPEKRKRQQSPLWQSRLLYAPGQAEAAEAGAEHRCHLPAQHRPRQRLPGAGPAKVRGQYREPHPGPAPPVRPVCRPSRRKGFGDLYPPDLAPHGVRGHGCRLVPLRPPLHGRPPQGLASLHRCHHV